MIYFYGDRDLAIVKCESSLMGFYKFNKWNWGPLVGQHDTIWMDIDEVRAIRRGGG